MKFTKSFLGQTLIDENVITEEQLAKALNSQKNNKGFLGKILVDLGYCKENDIARIIAKKEGVPYVSLENYIIDPAAVATLPPDAFRRYKVLPLSFSDNKLVMAMQQPSNIIAIDDLRILTGHDIKPVVVPDTEMEAAIDRYTRANMEFEHIADDEPVDGDVTDDLDEGESKPAVQLANMIISQAINDLASDIHIEPYEKYMRIRFRIDGVLHDIMQLPVKLHPSLVSRIKILANMNIAERRIPQDGRTALKIEGRLIDARVASLPTSHGERLTLRLLDRSAKMITLEELGVEPETLVKYRQIVNQPYGCILVTGPTGSGKTTSLYASLFTLDKKAKNIITVEDPVEYRMDDINQIQINPKAGLTFESGLRSILRSDPDIIMVGEIRDKETAKLAVESALTGHLVLSTLHTNDASGAISRLTEMGIEPFLITSSISCIIAQRLARMLCPNCKETYQVTREELLQLADFPLADGEETVTLYKPVGCMRCSNTGYRGRSGVFELLVITDQIQRMTLTRSSAREIRKAAIEEGMVTLRRDGMLKVKRGLTSLEELMRVVQ